MQENVEVRLLYVKRGKTMREVVKSGYLKKSQNCKMNVPIELIRGVDEGGEYFEIEIDGVFWCDIDAPHHAAILFELLSEGATKYMHYEKRS